MITLRRTNGSNIPASVERHLRSARILLRAGHRREAAALYA
jgi:hypothetical protein